MAESDSGKIPTPIPSQRPDQQPTRFNIRGHRRTHEGFLIVDQAEVTYERFDGTMSKERTRDVCERGDSAAALLYDPDYRQVILVNQFRLPTAAPFRNLVKTKGRFAAKDGEYAGHDGNGWLLETAAGTMADGDKTPEDCIRREIREETGFRIQLTQLEQIVSFFSSPGGTSEVIHLYFAEVTQTDLRDEGGGYSIGENIRVVRIDVDDFFLRLSRRQFQDPKIIIAGYWLRDRLAARRLEEKGRSQKFRFPVLKGGKHTGQYIGIATGSIVDVDGVEACVNSENTSMIMDRPLSRSVSGAIRWHGARKRRTRDNREVLDQDIIADALKSKLRGHNYVNLTQVIETEAGELEQKGMRSIFHVAIADGFREQNLKSDLPTLKACIDAVLARIEASRWRRAGGLASNRFRTAVIPLIGTGQGGLTRNEVAPSLVSRILAFYEANPNAALSEIYLCAFNQEDRHVLEALLQTYCDQGILGTPEQVDGHRPSGPVKAAPTVQPKGS